MQIYIPARNTANITNRKDNASKRSLSLRMRLPNTLLKRLDHHASHLSFHSTHNRRMQLIPKLKPHLQIDLRLWTARRIHRRQRRQFPPRIEILEDTLGCARKEPAHPAFTAVVLSRALPIFCTAPRFDSPLARIAVNLRGERFAERTVPHCQKGLCRVSGFRIAGCHGRGYEEGEELRVRFDGGYHFEEERGREGKCACGCEDALRITVVVAAWRGGEEGGQRGEVEGPAGSPCRT